MQKTLRINIQARNQLIKRTQAQQTKRTRDEWKQWKRMREVNDRKLVDYTREERKARREDWILGPLAPNRNSGTEKGVFGTVEIELIQTPDVPKRARGSPLVHGYDARDYDGKDSKLKFTGDTIVGNVVEGDRVVVVAGAERIRGQIGVVSTVDLDKEEVKISNVNVADIRIPPTAPETPGQESARYNTMEVSIPMSHVRLVCRIVDKKGRGQDYIVRHVHAGAPYAQRAQGSNTPAHTRYVSGVKEPNGKDMAIPWPETTIDANFNHNEPDTPRSVVESNDWAASIFYVPLGYTFVADTNNELARMAIAPYTLGQLDVKNMVDAPNEQRAGLHGFTNSEKLEARRTRIARGIMGELRSKTNNAKLSHDDNNWVKSKLLEDARAIWWQERKILTPAAEAAERAAERVTDETTGETIAAPKMRLARETEELVRQVQEASLQQRYKATDPKFGRRLRHTQTMEQMAA